MENSKKKVIFAIVCCHGNSLQYTHEQKGNLRCVPSLHCECQELKEARKGFSLHAHAQSTHAITKMYASAK